MRSSKKKLFNIDNYIDMTENEIKIMEAEVIPAHLRMVEQEYDVKILLAVESGSRAWGFESADSDWDVRFIYVHKPEWYLRVQEQRDVIEQMYDDGVDLAGWELRKALSLLMRSNPQMFEWLNSPKVYYADSHFMSRIAKVEKDFFNPVKSMYHYNRIYNKHNERYLQQADCNMKRFLYYLRGILACQWIERYKTLPPVRFQELYRSIVEDSRLQAKIDDLIALKRAGSECDIKVVDSNLMRYSQVLAAKYNETIGSFRPEQDKVSPAQLDAILYDAVLGSDSVGFNNKH